MSDPEKRYGRRAIIGLVYEYQADEELPVCLARQHEDIISAEAITRVTLTAAEVIIS